MRAQKRTGNLPWRETGLTIKLKGEMENLTTIKNAAVKAFTHSHGDLEESVFVQFFCEHVSFSD